MKQTHPAVDGTTWRAHTDFHVVIQPQRGTVSMSKFAVKSDFCEWGCRTGGNSSPLSWGVWGTCHFEETCGYGATSSTKAGQMPMKRNDPHAPSRSLMTCRACLYQTWQRHYAYALELHILQGSAHSTVHDQMDHRQACVRWMPKKLRLRNSSRQTLMHLRC